MVPYDSAGGRIEVFTSKGRETKSNLVIKKAGPSDSGNYTCKPSIAREASIKVHVLESKSFNYVDQIVPIIDLPQLDIGEGIPFVKRENLPFLDISSTTYLPCLVNVVKERSPTVNYFLIRCCYNDFFDFDAVPITQ